MTDRLFADTNILIYAMDPRETEKRARSVTILDACARNHSLVTSPQTLNECYRVLVEKHRLVSNAEARQFIESLAWTCTAPLDSQTIVKAWEVADSRPYHWWDCLMLAAALRTPCAVFVTEDLRAGDEIDGMVLVNPFRTDISAFF